MKFFLVNFWSSHTVVPLVCGSRRRWPWRLSDATPRPPPSADPGVGLRGAEEPSIEPLASAAGPGASEGKALPPFQEVSWPPASSGVFPEGGQRGRVRRALGEGGRKSRRQGVTREAFQPGDLEFSQIPAPTRRTRPLLSPSGNTPVKFSFSQRGSATAGPPPRCCGGGPGQGRRPPAPRRAGPPARQHVLRVHGASRPGRGKARKGAGELTGGAPGTPGEARCGTRC